MKYSSLPAPPLNPLPTSSPISSLQLLFYTGAELTNNVTLVSGVEQSDSDIHIHVSTLFQILFPMWLLHNIEQNSLCYTVGPCLLSILNIAYRFKYSSVYVSLPAMILLC